LFVIIHKMNLDVKRLFVVLLV